MYGNVREWCQDHWHKNYEGAPTDGSAWLSDSDKEGRIVRGGRWLYYPRTCRSAYRSDFTPADRDNFIGFRVGCSTLKS